MTIIDYWNKPLDPDEPVWRYYRPTRFIALLNSSRRYLAAARQFDDRFEGAVAILPKPVFVDPRYAEMEMFEKAFWELTRLVKVECWHRADFESSAMWHLYAGERKGVAIRSTVGRALASMHPFRATPKSLPEQPHAGGVRYIDLTKVRLKLGTEERFFTKHRAFEWEREFRIIISLRSAEEFGVSVPEKGIEVACDLSELVESVFIGPELDAAERDEVFAACDAAGLKPRVVVSSLLCEPRYT
jgi:hypothetical protein